jgi:hypothetical protein
VSQPLKVATQTPSATTDKAASETQMPFVGRITGMVDCQWSDPNTAVPGPVAVPLGRRYALSAGLLEITYDTGAKVILQGPVTYEVESPNSGYMSVGKLTARVEKRVDSGQWIVDSTASHAANPQSLIRNPLRPTTRCPLFAVRTPTAMVTDLGTEFGVEVSENGVTETYVFVGKVLAEQTTHDGGAMSSRTLSAGEAARIESGRVAMLSQEGSSRKFIRSVPRPEPPVKFIGPVPYQSFENRDATSNISPFSKIAGGPFGPLSGDKGQRSWTGPQGQYFYLEDMESGEIHAPGLSRMGGHIQGVTVKPDTTDSVDEDDGVIDNANRGDITHSLWFGGDGGALTIWFDANVLGRLPTHVGFVITDCSPDVNTRVEVFDQAHRLLAKEKLYNVTFAEADHRAGPGRAAESRFFGIVRANAEDRGGIGSIVLTEVFPNDRRADQGIEIDHIQYGAALPVEKE